MPNLIELSKTLLEPDEAILASVVGQYEKVRPNGKKEHVRTGILLATDRRIVFYAKKITGHDFETFTYPLVTSIVQGKNLLGHNVQIIAAGARVEVKWIKDVDSLANFVEIARGNMAAARQPSVSPGSAQKRDDPIEQIRKLGELRDAGIISAQEFEAKKAKLLSQI